ncbi:MAG: cytochrome c [Nitrospiraceae bacterium]|nr:cytochrome c [Nitrospiraceae bacterium]
MKHAGLSKLAVVVGAIGFGLAVAGCGGGGEGGGEGPIVPPPPAPAEYADKHMPAGWWTDPKIVEEGKEIYIGAKNPDVNCASCHGKDGKPVKAGARDFRNGDRMKMYSDSVWFWRISEGVPNTKMKAWKSKLSDEDRWKVMAFEASFGLAGKGWDPNKKEWVPANQVK